MLRILSPGHSHPKPIDARLPVSTPTHPYEHNRPGPNHRFSTSSAPQAPRWSLPRTTLLAIAERRSQGRLYLHRGPCSAHREPASASNCSAREYSSDLSHRHIHRLPLLRPRHPPIRVRHPHNLSRRPIEHQVDSSTTPPSIPVAKIIEHPRPNADYHPGRHKTQHVLEIPVRTCTTNWRQPGGVGARAKKQLSNCRVVCEPRTRPENTLDDSHVTCVVPLWPIHRDVRLPPIPVSRQVHKRANVGHQRFVQIQVACAPWIDADEQNLCPSARSYCRWKLVIWPPRTWATEPKRFRTVLALVHRSQQIFPCLHPSLSLTRPPAPDARQSSPAAPSPPSPASLLCYRVLLQTTPSHPAA